MSNYGYYCSQKFWWLTVDIEKLQTYSCCSATPQKIDLRWLDQNSGNLFNTPDLINERRSMLDNQPVASCASTCWNAEANGLPSRRLNMSSNNRTHIELIQQPEILHIVIGTQCNMTCIYCCKHYSSAWGRDVINNGGYPIDTGDDRFTVNSTDKILQQLSQKEIRISNVRNIILDEFVKLTHQPTVREINITGGEPFLYLDLQNLVDTLPLNTPIKVWSGLGVNEKRFAQELKELAKHDNVKIVISAENIGPAYEFARYGNSWDRLKNNISLIEEYRINYEFNATVSNITVEGLADFVEYAGSTKVNFELCNDPTFLAVNVLDSATKQRVIANLDKLPKQARDLINKSLSIDATPEQVYNLKMYLTEFTKRRQIDLPSYFDWVMDYAG